MRHVVVLDDLREMEIRPTELFGRYADLAETECAKLAAAGDRLIPAVCPACGETGRRPGFAKFGFAYHECAGCETLYVSPRPSQEHIRAYLQRSAVAEFRRSQLVKRTSENRSEKIFRPRAQWVASLTKEWGRGAQSYADAFSKYEIFLERIADLRMFGRKYVVSAEPGIAETCRPWGFEALESLAGVPEPAGVAVVTAWEILNSVQSPREFLESIHKALAPGGLLFLTVVNRGGFDLQVLWGHGRNILPIDHLNLFSIEGLGRLLEDLGFRILELSTPSKS